MKTRILYVDDEALMRRAFERAVKRSDFDVTFAGSGGDAMKIAAKETFDVIISDYRLNDSDGIELLEKIHALQPAAELVLVSGYFDPQENQAAMDRAGISLFVAKPWDNRGFLHVLENLARSRKTKN